MINQQVSLANQVLKNPKANNAQHVPKIVELDDFDTVFMRKNYLKSTWRKTNRDLRLVTNIICL